MSEYTAKNREQDAKAFLSSQYGQYIMEILNQKASGHLANARNVKEEHPGRHLAKYDEVESLISLLEDSNSPRGQ